MRRRGRDEIAQCVMSTTTVTTRAGRSNREEGGEESTVAFFTDLRWHNETYMKWCKETFKACQF